MSKFCSLFSSSSGNCTYISNGNSGILIDAGVSAKRIATALTDRDIDPNSIKGIFITHEHGDHIKGMRVLASRFSIPVFATAGTLKELDNRDELCKKFSAFEVGTNGDEVGGMLVRSFATPHDSAQSCGYTIEMPDGTRVAIATDMGHVSEDIFEELSKCELVMLESNHDVGMLQNGQYPYGLKRRILSDVGHLSNDTCAKIAAQLVSNKTTRLFLAHLSGENNMPSLAYETNLCEIKSTGAKLGTDYTLQVNMSQNDKGIIAF